jgi:hypothetical protein
VQLPAPGTIHVRHRFVACQRSCLAERTALDQPLVRGTTELCLFVDIDLLYKQNQGRPGGNAIVEH